MKYCSDFDLTLIVTAVNRSMMGKHHHRPFLLLLAGASAFILSPYHQTHRPTILLHSVDSSSSTPQWHVYVDQSKASLDKGGAATLDAFIALAPPSHVKVFAAMFESSSKGPLVRCIDTNHPNSFDVGIVDSVDKVERILRKHMKLSSLNSTTERLKLKYQGSSHLERGNIQQAIDCYDVALDETSNDGGLFLLRADAYLQRAALHREKLRYSVEQLTEGVDLNALEQAAAVAVQQTDLADALFQRIVRVTTLQERQFRRVQYRHGMYQYALLQAAQDAFRATQLLPSSAEAWRRAADILAQLWKLKEAVQYYETAMELDNHTVTSNTAIQQIYKRQSLLESARTYGWSEDTLRLALDVAQ